jgi:hypothetical protein
MSESVGSADRIRSASRTSGRPGSADQCGRCDYSLMALYDIDSSDIHRIDHPKSLVTLMGDHYVDPIVIDRLRLAERS